MVLLMMMVVMMVKVKDKPVGSPMVSTEKLSQ
jgi:hypothetical protein